MATKKVAIRQLARNHRESKKHIDSPLAKYNSSGQLLCVLCNVPIKNALLWDSHIFGKKHKQNLADLKSKSNRSNQTAVNPPVVSTSQNDDISFVRPQTKRTHNEIETPGSIPEKKIKVSSDTATVSLTGKPGDSMTIKEQENNSSGSNLLNTTPNVPSDFFDSPQYAKQFTEQNISSKNDPIGSSIPEGFFDDPKQDAKVRKVEYKDPVEEEWEKFQKAMQVESQVSQSILEDEDEESRVDRELSELSEQRLFFLRADALRDKQSIIRDKVTKEAILRKDVKDEHSHDSDDSDFEEFFDWRAKKAL